MPIPDTQGVPPFAEFDDLKRKLNELVQKYNNLLVNLDSLNVVSLTADHVDTGTLDANVVTIAAEDGSYSYTLDGTGIKANNGSVDTLKFDLATGLLTIVSALIQSATGYPRVELNSSTNLLAAYLTANEAIRVVPNFSGGNPAVYFTTGGTNVAYLQDFGTIFGLITLGGVKDLQIGSGKTLYLTANNGIELTCAGVRINGNTGQSASISYVKNVIAGIPSYGSMNFTNGILTSYT